LVEAGNSRFPEAIAEYKSAIRLTSDPQMLTVSYENLGAIYRHLRDYPKGLSYERELKIIPTETRAFMAIIELRPEQAEHQ
jgi:hypothetical protein